MAMKRFPVEEYATLEMNQVEYIRQGMVISQTPLGEEFTKEAPCENGMWVCADKSKGTIDSIEALDELLGIVYTTEKEYDMNHYGLKTFGRKIAGDYPRVGVLSKSDTVTTNCLQYDDADFADEEALFEALKNIKEAPLFVVPVVGSPVPQLVTEAPAEGPYAKVTKFYTVPNGEPGVKYQMQRV